MALINILATAARRTTIMKCLGRVGMICHAMRYLHCARAPRIYAIDTKQNVTTDALAGLFTLPLR